ncbi:MAG: hypothetical protein GY927_17940 [bacterium]|nr:hypothetical protein [bacterium]
MVCLPWVLKNINHTKQICSDINRWICSRKYIPVLVIILVNTYAIAHAQNNDGILAGGNLVVSGFSGALNQDGLPLSQSSATKIEETFINPNGASLKVLDVSTPPNSVNGTLILPGIKLEAFAKDIGQVFGLSLDNATPPNIYAAATSVHGLQIVAPDSDGDGRPERIKVGQAEAKWMAGQFGETKGGGPGTVWKIDGVSGEITLFADLVTNGQSNSGPGLGNIAFDPDHQQLFVSDLDTGLVHRLDMSGTDLGSYDHGVNGRPNNGLPPVPMDPANRLDITNSGFDAEDPDSWKFAKLERRTWGLAYHKRRLYYAVAEGPQIWSVGIASDGTFAEDARQELDVDAAPKNHPVSDIAFTSRGHMILAQRGGIKSYFDYSQYQAPRKNKVLRYHLESPDDPATPSRWLNVPEEYAIGFQAVHRNASGGIAIGYGYRRQLDGSYGFGACEGTLWATGDALRDNLAYQKRLEKDGPMIVHGLQGNPISYVKPKNTPPWKTYFIDFDGTYSDPDAAGHVGDVEVYRKCGGDQVTTVGPPPTNSPVYDIKVQKDGPINCQPGQDCRYTITMTNQGPGNYRGPLIIEDNATSRQTPANVTSGVTLISANPSPPWACVQTSANDINCRHPVTTLKAGQSKRLSLTVKFWSQGAEDIDNCALLATPVDDADPLNNRSCTTTIFKPGGGGDKSGISLEKTGDTKCKPGGMCFYTIKITNNGKKVIGGGFPFTDTPPKGWKYFASKPSKEAPPYKCQQSTSGAVVNCIQPLIWHRLAAGKSFTVQLAFKVPASHVSGKVQNCAALAPPKGKAAKQSCWDTEIGSVKTPEADLKITKNGDLECVPGGPCSYRMIVENVGKKDFNGNVSILDTLPKGVKLTGYGPNPQWNCKQVVDDRVACVSARTTLKFGDKVELQLKTKWPPASSFNGEAFLTNRAKIEKLKPGQDTNPNNNEDIHNAYVIMTLVPDAADLEVKKMGPAVCSNQGLCEYTINVKNVGTKPYNERIIIKDQISGLPGVKQVHSKISATLPECDQVPLHPDRISCFQERMTFPGNQFTPLAPNDSYKFKISLKVPTGIAGTFKNCAELSAFNPKLDGNPNNNKDCVTTKIISSDLVIKKTGPAQCTAGAKCVYTVTITNKGTSPYEYKIGFTDVMTGIAGIKYVPHKSNPGMATFKMRDCYQENDSTIGCSKHRNLGVGVGPGASNKVPDPLLPGASHVFSLPLKMPFKANGTLRNCAKADFGESCIDTKITTPRLRIEKTGDPGCVLSKKKSRSCEFKIRVINDGPGMYIGPIFVNDTLPPQMEFNGFTSKPGWLCSRQKSIASGVPIKVTSIYCYHKSTFLKPGEASEVVAFKVKLKKTSLSEVKNCAHYRVFTKEDLLKLSQSSKIRLFETYLQTQGKSGIVIDGKLSQSEKDAARGTTIGVFPSGAFPIDTYLQKVDLAGFGAQQLSGKGCHVVRRQKEEKAQESKAIPDYTVIAKGTATCIPPHCSFYEFTARVKGDQSYKGPLNFQIKLPPDSDFPTAKITKSGASCPASSWTCTRSRDGFDCQSNYCAMKPGEEVAVFLDGHHVPGMSQPPEKELIKTACGIVEWKVPKTDGGIETDYMGKSGKKRSQACFSTTIQARKKPTCTGGQYWNGEVCACPAGSDLVGGQCRKTPPPRPECFNGQVWNGRSCSCPAYRPVWKNGGCRAKPGIKPCNGGRFRVGTSCVCPGNKPVWRRGRCRVKPSEPKPCSGGRFRVGASCVCPANKPIWRRGRCRAKPPRPKPCSGGRFRVGTSCVCPTNKPIWRRGRCRVRPAPPPRYCTGGKVLVRGQCHCPWGQIPVGNRCKVIFGPGKNKGGPKPPPTCTGGRRWNGRSCVCPSGQSFVGRRCRKPGPSGRGGVTGTHDPKALCILAGKYWVNGNCINRIK